MKYVITGGAGNVSKPLAEKLLANGHDVTVVARNADHLKPLTDKGAKAAIGSIEDVAFLKQAFTGADAVYIMVPPQYGTDISLYEKMGNNYAEAIKASGVKNVVSLSSIGAHLPEGAGPVSGLYRLEQALNTLTDVNIKHLRPGFFYTNFLGSIGMIKHMNIMGGNYGDASSLMVLSAPEDIAEAAAEELTALNFKGHSVRYLASDERTGAEISKALGNAAGKPGLPWVEFSDDQSRDGMLQAGFPEGLVKNYVEMGACIRSGKFFEDYQKNRPSSLGKTKLEDFSGTFAHVYQAG